MTRNKKWQNKGTKETGTKGKNNKTIDAIEREKFSVP
jgi:hypothetical protein